MKTNKPTQRRSRLVWCSTFLLMIAVWSTPVLAQFLPPPLTLVQPLQLSHPRPFGLELSTPHSLGWSWALSYAYGNTHETSDLVASSHLNASGNEEAFDPGTAEAISARFPERQAYHIDLEVQVLQFEAVRALANGYDAGVRIPWYTVSPTFVDGFPTWWHDRLGISNEPRSFFDQEESSLFLSHSGASVVETDLRSEGFGNLDLWAGRTFPLARGRHRAWVSVSAPTADLPELGRPDWKIGARWAAFVPVGKTFLSGGVGWTSGGGETPTTDAADTWHIWTSMTYSLSSRFSLGVFARADTSPYKDLGGQLGHETAEFSVGGSLKIGESSLVQLAVGEDFPGMGLNPDFSIQLRLVHWPQSPREHQLE